MFFRATAARLAKIVYHPHCPPDDAKAYSLTLVKIVHEYKALTAAQLWDYAQHQGIRSKGHMKQLLKWLRQEKLLRVDDPEPDLNSDSHVYKLWRPLENEPAAIFKAEEKLEEIRQRDTNLLSMSREELRRKEYEERKQMGRRLTYWDL